MSLTLAPRLLEASGIALFASCVSPILGHARALLTRVRLALASLSLRARRLASPLRRASLQRSSRFRSLVAKPPSLVFTIYS